LSTGDELDRRKARLLDLLQHMKDKGGMSTVEVQTYMMAKYGMRPFTATEYLKQFHAAGVIKEVGSKWKVLRLLGDE
jgi:hypothetical protein